MCNVLYTKQQKHIRATNLGTYSYAVTDGGKGSDKGKFTTHTSNSLFYLSSIKG